MAPSNNLGQPPGGVPADQVMAPQLQRDLFLQSALRKCIPMDPIAWSAGSTVPVRVPQTGLAQKIRLVVSLTATASANSPAVTQRAPYAYLPNVKYTDPSGITRVDASAYELYLLMTTKKEFGFDPSNGNVGAWTAPATPAAIAYNNPTPTTVAAAVNFFVDVPISMSKRDTRGTILLESATSPSYIFVTMASTSQIIAASGVESVYTGAQTMTVTGTIQPFYYFWAPVWVDLNGQRTLPIPQADMALVHEVVSSRGSNALSTNSDNPYQLPTGRSYYKLIGQYVNNAAFSVGLTNVRFRYDSANVTLNESIQAYLERTREEFDRDFPQGVYVWDFVDRPWDSNHYGSLEAILTMDSTALTNAYVQYVRECLYIAPQA